MYGRGKIIFIGGGNRPGTHVPFAEVEVIDFGQASPAWRSVPAMQHPRQQHNATILPDGTVLVTGGTRGGGGPDRGFNDLSPGQPVHEAELWDPCTEQWTLLAAEAVDRCYHSTAILLPDGTVLSAGGGEYNPGGQPIPPEHVHRDGQIFHPPYLFRGDRPRIEEAPDQIAYRAAFQVQVSGPEVARVTLIRLGSVTHAFDENQRFDKLEFEARAGSLTVSAPLDANACPPGHYMLFALSKEDVPSLARIVRLGVGVAGSKRSVASAIAATRAAAPDRQGDLHERDRAIVRQSTGTRVIIGLTSNCPYGLARCWGGAYQALKRLDRVQAVRPIPNAEHSTAEVYLKDQGLPDLGRWLEQFVAAANGSYEFRGVEVTVTGTLVEQDGGLRLSRSSPRAELELRPLDEDGKIEWDLQRRAPLVTGAEELDAYRRLKDEVPSGAREVQITGPFRSEHGRPVLHVREFALGPA